MKLAILLILLLVLGCGIESNTQSNSDSLETHVYLENIQDTLLEENNPKLLDLSKHQLYIDTTRNSKFYKNINIWKNNIHNTNVLKVYLEELNKLSKSEKIEQNKFINKYIRINKLGDEFYLYDRCDGIDPRYELRDSAFVFLGPLENDAETIKEIYSINSDEIHLQMNTFERKSSNKVSEIRISKTKNRMIYLLEYENQNRVFEEFIVPVEYVGYFDLIVNHCPNMKRDEYIDTY